MIAPGRVEVGVGDQLPSGHSLQAEFEQVLWRAQSASVQCDEKCYIKLLQAQLEDAHKLLRNVRA